MKETRVDTVCGDRIDSVLVRLTKMLNNGWTLVGPIQVAYHVDGMFYLATITQVVAVGPE